MDHRVTLAICVVSCATASCGARDASPDAGTAECAPGDLEIDLSFVGLCDTVAGDWGETSVDVHVGNSTLTRSDAISWTRSKWVFRLPVAVGDGEQGVVQYRSLGDAGYQADGTATFIVQTSACDVVPLTASCTCPACVDAGP